MRIASYILSIFLLLAACKKENSIIGTWKLNSLFLDGEEISGTDMNNPTYTFSSDHKLTINVAEVEQKAIWEQQGSELNVTDEAYPDIKTTMNILTLSKDTFKYEIVSEGVTSIATLIRVKK